MNPPSSSQGTSRTPPVPPMPAASPLRKKLPDTRHSITMKNAVGAHEFYVHVGFYDDADYLRPGEIFINVAKEGSTLGGLCNIIAKAVSMALQHGVDWATISNKFHGVQFEPSGPSLNNRWDYTSLGHAIAHTVDLVIAQRADLWASDAPQPAVERVPAADLSMRAAAPTPTPTPTDATSSSDGHDAGDETYQGGAY